MVFFVVAALMSCIPVTNSVVTIIDLADFPKHHHHRNQPSSSSSIGDPTFEILTTTTISPNCTAPLQDITPTTTITTTTTTEKSTSNKLCPRRDPETVTVLTIDHGETAVACAINGEPLIDTNVRTLELQLSLRNGLFGGGEGTDRDCTAFCALNLVTSQQNDQSHFRWSRLGRCWRKFEGHDCKGSTPEEMGFAAHLKSAIFCPVEVAVVTKTFLEAAAAAAAGGISEHPRHEATTSSYHNDDGNDTPITSNVATPTPTMLDANVSHDGVAHDGVVISEHPSIQFGKSIVASSPPDPSKRIWTVTINTNTTKPSQDSSKPAATSMYLSTSQLW